MNNSRFPFIFSICAGLLLLAACATSPKPPTASAPTTTPIATSQPSPTSTPRRNPQPTFTLVPPSPTPTATRIACNLDSPYLGVSILAMQYIDIVDGCVTDIVPDNLTKTYSWGSWLPDGSGFVYLKGNCDGTSMKVCVWDVVKQTTTYCLLEGVSYYTSAKWSPDGTNLVAYQRSDATREKVFVTVASAQSGKVLYETKQTSSPSGNEERFLAWHPDGKHMLIAVDDGHEQAATIVDIESLSRISLAQFDGDLEYIARGLWINDGQDLVLGTIDPKLCCTGEGRPDAQRVYRVRSDDKNINRLVKNINIATLFVAHDQRRLLLDTYSFGNDPSPAYWLDLDSGKLTRVLSDEFEERHPWLLGLTLDDRYIVLSDGQYQTWLFDTETGHLTQSPMGIYDTIEWRP